MAEYDRPAPKRRQPAPAATILPDPQQPHNKLASVRAIDPATLGTSAVIATESTERVEAVLLAAAPAFTSAALH